jgi:hypothetical protein
MEELVDQPKLALVSYGDCLRAVGGDSMVNVWLGRLWRWWWWWWKMHWRCNAWEGRSSDTRLVPYNNQDAFPNDWK